MALLLCALVVAVSSAADTRPGSVASSDRSDTSATGGTGVRATGSDVRDVLALSSADRTPGRAMSSVVGVGGSPIEASAVATPAGSPGGAAVAAGPTTTPAASQPTRIAIPAIAVDARLTDLGIADDGTIEVPSVPSQAGWLDSTPAPGQQGPAVIAGHVDSQTGPAVFYRLSSLRTGDRIEVTRNDGRTVDFTVDGVRVYPQSDFPTAAVYGPEPGPALRLITCGGDYLRSAGGYQDNVVVFAS